MLRALLSVDAVVARTRPAWLWFGQLAVAILGVHLAADRLDDLLGQLLVSTGLAWPEPETPLLLGTWGAVLLELWVVVWIVGTLVWARGEPLDHPRKWLARWSVQAFLAPLAWLPISLAGAWVFGMAVEDLVAPWLPSGASAIGWFAAAWVALRLSLTGLLVVVLRTPEPRRRVEGWIWVVPVTIVAALAVRYGLPVWGWL